jgi:hypothetical protein
MCFYAILLNMITLNSVGPGFPEDNGFNILYVALTPTNDLSILNRKEMA